MGKRKVSLNLQILIGAVTGVVLGLSFHGKAATSVLYGPFIYSCELIGGIFVSLLKMILIPLVFTSIAIGIANLRAHARMSRVWKITLVYFLATSFFAATLGLVVMNIFNPGLGLKLEMFKDVMTGFNADSMTVAQFFKTFFLGLFVNPVSAMASGNVVAVVMFSLILGIALVIGGKRTENILIFLNELFEVVMMIVEGIMRLAPVGIMALLAKLVASQDVSLLSTLGKFMLIVTLTTLFHGMVVLPSLLFAFTRMSPLQFFTGFREALITAFSTSSSSATLPVSLRCVENNLKVDKSIAGFVLPLGATVNMDGTALYEALAALFVANIAGAYTSILSSKALW